MNVIFAGYRKWSYQILKNLLKEKNSSWNISACISTPTAEVDFSQLEIPCLIENPRMLHDGDVLKKIMRYKPDVFLFYGWSWMIPKEFYEQFPCIVLHPSPLPKYRGGSPLQHQIIAGESTSAITLFQVGEKIDDGSIYAQKQFSLDGNLEDIFLKIIRIGTQLTKKTLSQLAHGKTQTVPQDSTKATEYKRRKPEESEITLADFQTKSAKQLSDFIRALADPYPNAFFVCKDGKKIFFKSVTLEE